jgi:hypothetical protein
MPQPDVYKILKDLELKAVGLDPRTNEMQAGYFCSFRDIGLPIHKDDFDNPWSPLGGNLAKDLPPTPPADPATAPKTGSSQLDPNVAFSAAIGKSQQAYLNGFMLVDDKLRMNGSYSVMPSSSKISDSWWAIITGANGVPTDSVISDDLKAAYDATRAKLMDADGNPTPHYNAYMQYEDVYKDKVKAWHRAYAGAFTDPMKLQTWPVEGTSYEDDANEAWDRWISFGFKEEIENAIATLAAQGTDPAIALIARAKQHYQNSLNSFPSISEIPYTMFLPQSWYDPDNDDGWTTYTSADYHCETHYNSSSTSYGGGGGIDIGFWSSTGSFEHSDSRTSLQISGDDLEISFSYCTVDIKRPWLDTSLLNLGNWFLMGDYKKGCISDGTFGQEKPKDGIEPTFLPSITTSLILIKDLKIQWSSYRSDMDAFQSTTDSGGSIGWGPFCVSGHYEHHSESTNWEYDSASRGLSVHGVQVIGYVSMINPLCPRVDSSAYMQKADKNNKTPAGAGH